MLLGLPDQVHLPERALVSEFLRADVLRREADLLRIHQQHPSGGARADHFVGLAQRPGERFLADDVLAGLGRGDGDVSVQRVRRRDAHHVDLGSVG